MVYGFKSAARVPAGVTADGVVEERERIAREYGKASLSASTTAVLSEPEKFPNLRAFAPDDPEEALKKCVEQGIRYAYASVIEIKVEGAPKGAPPPREVRVFHVVPDEQGDMIYQPLTVIRENPDQKKFLVAQLRKEAETFAAKMNDVLAELEAAV